MIDPKFNKKVKVYLQYVTVSNDVGTNVVLGGGQSGFGSSVAGTAILENENPTGSYESPSVLSAKKAVVPWAAIE